MKQMVIFCFAIAVTMLMGCTENSVFLPDVDPVLKSQPGSSQLLKGMDKPAAKPAGTTQENFSPATLPYIGVGTVDFSGNEGYFDEMEIIAYLSLYT